jgi:hypothetical protein
MTSRARLAFALAACVLAVGAAAQPKASEQGAGNGQREHAQESQPQTRGADPSEQAETRALDRQNEYRNRAKDDPQDGGSETGLFAWVERWWTDFVRLVELNDKFLVAFSTLVTAAFTVILGGATLALWNATAKLVKGAESTAERQLRAYVGVADDKVDAIAPNHKPVVKLEFKNFGQTPAHRVVIWTEVVAMEPSAATFTERSAAEPGRRVLHPGAAITVFSIKDEALTRFEFSNIAIDKVRLYCFGTIWYVDAFNQTRTTKFRYETRGGRIAAMERLLVSDEGNEAD